MQDGVICNEALEKSETIVLRLLRSGKLSGFRGNKKYLKCLSNVLRLCSSSFCSILNLNTQNVRRSVSQMLTSCAHVQGSSPEGQPWLENVSAACLFLQIKIHVQGWSACHTSLSFGWSWINMVCIFRSHSYVERPFLFLKGQEVETSPSAAARACTICACLVTLSSSSNIQTSVQFKLAGHGPVTYFPDNMLCNIKDEAVCHQLTNLYRHIAPANRHETPDSTARQKQERNEHKRGKKSTKPVSKSERSEQGCRC